MPGYRFRVLQHVGLTVCCILLLSCGSLWARDGLDTKDSSRNQTNPLKKEGSILLTINAFNIKTKTIVDGNVSITDNESGRVILFDMPTNDSIRQKFTTVQAGGSYRVTITASGYHKNVFDVDINPNLAKDSCKNLVANDSTLAFNVYLERPKPGEHLNFFHIYFWNNSYVLLPKPRDDLENVLAMMKENEDMHIKIHGHTASSRRGPLIPPAKAQGGDWKVFTLASRRNKKIEKGSAMKLSELRAQTVKRYLVQNGIEPERIQTEGHGGKDLLYDKDSMQAHKNKRVEIEILDY